MPGRHCKQNYNPGVQENGRCVLNHMLAKVIVVRKKVNDKTVGCGYGAIERGFIGIFDIVVDKNHRGNGYGRDIMDGILSAAVEKEVNRAYLGVIVGNIPAENLYHKLGFTELYRYWYRKR